MLNGVLNDILNDVEFPNDIYKAIKAQLTASYSYWKKRGFVENPDDVTIRAIPMEDGTLFIEATCAADGAGAFKASVPISMWRSKHKA